MDADRWQRLSPLLDALIELEPGARAQSLASLRDDDPQLAGELEELLALEEGQEDFLAEPVVSQLPHARTGAMVGPYQLERMIGEGGMGQVWLAGRADGLYQRRVALKLLRPGLGDPNLRLRFTRERQILARLEHAHIARLLDAGISSDQQPYLALEYVDGEPITDWCRARAPTIRQRIHLFLQVCEAVSHAHANLIVHRDLKPSNILVTPLDEVRLLDFGIAKLLDTPDAAPDNTRTGLRAFTLHYAAPEQIRGEPVTTMTDVYSLGVVLYELLVGAKPYRLKRQSDAEWEEAILAVDPARPSVALQRRADDATLTPPQLRRQAREIAGDLDNIVLKALAKLPEHRYPSVEALTLDLRRHLDGQAVHARPASLAYRVRKYVSRHRWTLATVAAIGVVLVASLGIVGWQAQQAVQQAARAQALQSFMVGLFENASAAPDGAPLDIRRLLEDGVRRGDLELAQQPVARAELLGVIARLRSGLGDYAEALALQERQATIIDALDSPPASLRLQAVTDMGRTRRLLGQASGCVKAMHPWRALSRREQERLPLQAADFHAQLARCQRDAGQLDAARAGFQRSLAIRRNANGQDAGVVEDLSDLAGLRAAAGQSALALREQRAALAMLRARVGGRHPLAVEILRRTCALQRELGDVGAAERDCREALALALEVHGDQHRATIDVRRQLAALLVDEGRISEADTALRDAQAWLLARLGADHSDVARNYNSLAVVAWERGDLAAALRDLRRANAIWRRQGDKSLLAGGLFNQAQVLHEAGSDDEAATLLQEVLALRKDAFGEGHGQVGSTWRMIGEVAAARGSDDEALAALRRAVALTSSSFGAAHPASRRAELALATFEAGHGVIGAVARLDHLGALPESDIELRKIAWRARAAAAAFRCGGPRRAESLAALVALGRTVAMAQPEGGVVAREIERWRQHCGADAAAP
ncbi:serine/threonine-protein kinase [Luteimonas sp. MC1828]|uniref:serine/threonine-protein kinase n=1 Tax=Luteimonas sp. MC1828 TaxID=2799787 RepID=UPI0018F182A0|nr:serine/threonine-protein kinase [Luteimonas sp. MC1828]MBJ7575644.1 protein kinase [Luteimonas sp. MC1828]